MFDAWYRMGAVLVCAPAKCGSTALARFGFGCINKGELDAKARRDGFGPYQPGEVVRLYRDMPKLLAVREPVSRFASLWRHKCRDDPKDALSTRLHGLTPEELLARITRFPLGDYHWRPQYLYAVPGARAVPWTDLLAAVGIKGDAVNVTAVRPDDPEMPDLSVAFAQDFALWEAARA